MDRLRSEALRLYRRYEVELVQALNLCPWAARARREGHVTERVLLDRALDAAGTARVVRELGDDHEVHIGLLLFPRLTVRRHDFQRFVSEVRDEAARQGEMLMALAAFHPDAEPDDAAAERLVPFLRRTPDPTIQLVRCAVLDRVRDDHPHGTDFMDPDTLDLSALLTTPPVVPLHERVAESNLERVRSVGIDQVRAMLDDIRADRERTYARLVP
jgi:hypothetical protein